MKVEMCTEDMSVKRRSRLRYKYTYLIVLYKLISYIIFLIQFYSFRSKIIDVFTHIRLTIFFKYFSRHSTYFINSYIADKQYGMRLARRSHEQAPIEDRRYGKSISFINKI